MSRCNAQKNFQATLLDSIATTCHLIKLNLDNQYSSKKASANHKSHGCFVLTELWHNLLMYKHTHTLFLSYGTAAALYQKIEILRFSDINSTGCKFSMTVGFCNPCWSFRFVFCFVVVFFFFASISSKDADWITEDAASMSLKDDGGEWIVPIAGSSRVSTTENLLITGSTIFFVTFCPRTFFVSVRIAFGTFSDGLWFVIEVSCPRVMLTMYLPTVLRAPDEKEGKNGKCLSVRWQGQMRLIRDVAIWNIDDVEESNWFRFFC